MMKKVFFSVVDATAASILGSVEIFLLFVKVHVFKKSLPNYSKVIEKKLYRGGQPSKHGLQELKKQGIGLVVNLRARNSEKKKIARLFGDKMLSRHLPIYPFRPCEEAVIEFLKLFTKEIKFPVFVHCFHGADRTGLMCAMYRIVFEGWDKAAAIIEMKKNGFHFWHRSIITYIEESDIDHIKKRVFARN